MLAQHQTDVSGAAVVTESLTRRFGDQVAVDHVDLTVPRGTTFGLLGRNGAGKTTTIKMLITLLPPSEGRAWVAGLSPSRCAAMSATCRSCCPPTAH